MKGCDERRMMMMFVRMGSGVLRHYYWLNEVGQEGGWSIMKKQVFQEARYLTYVLEIGGKIFKWWGGNCSNGGIPYV